MSKQLACPFCNQQMEMQDRRTNKFCKSCRDLGQPLVPQAEKLRLSEDEIVAVTIGKKKYSVIEKVSSQIAELPTEKAKKELDMLLKLRNMAGSYNSYWLKSELLASGKLGIVCEKCGSKKFESLEFIGRESDPYDFDHLLYRYLRCLDCKTVESEWKYFNKI